MTKLEELIQKLCPNGVEHKSLNEVSEMKRGTSITKKDIVEGEIPVVSGGREPAYYCDKYNRDGETITVAGSGAGAGYVQYWTKPIFVCDAFSIQGNPGIQTKYIYYFLTNIQDYIYSTKKGGGVPHVHISSIENVSVPVPPLPVQREIVRILDNFTELTTELTAELTARKQQYAYYRDKLLTFENFTEWRTLDDVIVSLNTGLNPRQFFKLNPDDAHNYYVTIREIQNGTIVVSDKTDRINDDALRLCNNRSNLEVGDVLFSGTGTIGETAVISEPPTNWNIKEGIYVIKPRKEVLHPRYLMYILRTDALRSAIFKKVAGGTVKSIPMAEMRNLRVPVPSLKIQKRLVEVLDNFDSICTDLSSGLPAEIEARQKQYEYYRDKLLSFTPAD